MNIHDSSLVVLSRCRHFNVDIFVVNFSSVSCSDMSQLVIRARETGVCGVYTRQIDELGLDVAVL